MSGVAYIRFFGDDWLSGTQEMSLEERGVLITIVALTAATGRPPAADYKRLGRRFGCTSAKARRLVETLEALGKISVDDGDILNDRALTETAISAKNSKSQSENVRSRWAKHKEKLNENNGRGDTTVIPPLYQPEPEPDKKSNADALLVGSEDPSPADPPPNPKPILPINDTAKAVEVYNAQASVSGWPRVQSVSSSRSKLLNLRMGEAGGIDGWSVALEKAAASDFLCGRTDRGWSGFGFDWLIKASNFTKIMEGNYDNRDHNPGSGPAGGGRGGMVDAFAALAARQQ